MMEVFFEFPGIGELTVEHLFYLLDNMPILFVCTDRDGNRYLCSCFQMDEGWVIGRVDDSALIDLIDDEITIRKVFEERCQATWVVSWDGEKFRVAQNAPKDVLPVKGALLGLAYEKSGKYKERLKEYVRDIKSKVFIKTCQVGAPVWETGLISDADSKNRLLVGHLIGREEENQTASLSPILAVAA